MIDKKCVKKNTFICQNWQVTVRKKSFSCKRKSHHTVHTNPSSSLFLFLPPPPFHEKSPPQPQPPFVEPFHGLALLHPQPPSTTTPKTLFLSPSSSSPSFLPKPTHREPILLSLIFVLALLLLTYEAITPSPVLPLWLSISQKPHRSSMSMLLFAKPTIGGEGSCWGKGGIVNSGLKCRGWQVVWGESCCC